MTLKLSFIIIGLTLLISACGQKVSTEPKDYFLNNFGEYKLDDADKLTLKWEDKAYHIKEHQPALYKKLRKTFKGEKSAIIYTVTIHDDDKKAKDELKTAVDCPAPETKTTQPYKEQPLKNSSGKEVGQILVCSSGGDYFDKARYEITLLNGRQTFTAYGDYQTSLEKVSGFLKKIPDLKDIDWSEFDTLIAGIQNQKQVTKDELTKLSPPEQLTETPYIKGKVFQSTAVQGGFFNGDMIAKNAEELGTIVKVDCKKSFKIGNYNAEGQTVPAYASECNATLIDYTIPAVIAKKSFVNSEMAASMTFGTKDGKIQRDEVVASEPRGEVQKWLNSLPRK